jgi:AmmeMemoRadiSam system protein B/AmmeMemoRadiSam system protein A
MEIRRPAVAGAFYPGDPVALSKMIAEFYSGIKKRPLAGKPLAVIAPHAGYVYSGKTAATAYKHLEGYRFDDVVVISPSHTVFFQGASVYNGDGYQTPLGVIEINQELSREIASIHPSVFLSNKGHTGGSIRGEHALEVQLPLLQQVLGKFKLTAIVMGDQEETTCRALGEVTASVLSEREALIVASTDLSHFHSEKEARKLDGVIRHAMEAYDPDMLLSVLASGRGEACGGGPVVAAMMATKKLGGDEVIVTNYTTSGEVTGDYSGVVGYLSAVIISKKEISRKNAATGAVSRKNEDGHLSEQDKGYLKDLARRAIGAELENKAFMPPEPDSKLLKEKRGAFVTLKTRGALRGCIGLIRAARPLYQAVAEMALEAAFNDPRFSPLDKSEFGGLEIEISALSPLIRVQDVSEIQVGRDGLMVVLGGHSGLLLPQVATENGWDRIMLLEQTCLKAGLPKNSYKEKETQVYRFTAEVF